MEGKTITVFYADYPDIRIIIRRGWRIVNEAAKPDGLVLILGD